MPEQTLGGLRVLDLSHYVSGPYCTRLLAGWGAEVIKVEKPGEGDGARRVGPFPGDEPHPENSALFLYLNTGKKSITLNLKTTTGVKIFKELARDSDVLVENFEPRVMPSLGLDYETLQKINPKLVMTSITSFGQTGPYRDYKAYSIISYAMGGLMYISGQPDREPLQNSSSLPEYGGGMYGFVGTMMALRSRKNTGRGQHVDISIMECVAGNHQFTLTWPAYSGVLLERPGWNSPVFPCKDGYVIMGLIRVEPALLAQLTGIPEIAEDPRFQTEQGRADNESELQALVVRGFKNLGKREIFNTCASWGMICGIISTVDEVLADPQYRARDYWVELEHPYAGKLTYPGAPVRMTETQWKVQRAPLLGEHNQEVYCARLGYTKEDLVTLSETGVI